MNMWKKILIVSCGLFLFSCNNWLDLQPEGEASQTELFSTADGYRSVLNGIYKSMGQADLYGVELQFGLVDCMSQMYTFYSSSENNWATAYEAAKAFNFTDNGLQDKIKYIWKSGFNVIANANVLIQNVADESAEIFELGEMEKNMILGEAYACRGLMHFDLLRLFAPALMNDDGASYVPYVDKFPEILGERIAVKPFLEKVVDDLEHARELVVAFDTSLIGNGANASGRSRFYNELESGIAGEDPKGINDFYKGRGYRLSYYGITALLARVYQYAGMHDKAFAEAQKIIEAQVPYVNGGTTQLYREDYNVVWMDQEQREDLKRVAGLIFAVYNERAYEVGDGGLGLSSFFQKRQTGMQSGQWMLVDYDVQHIFQSVAGADESESDYRYRLIYKANDIYPISGKWYLNDDPEIRDKHLTILPIIRLAEMQYIVAECYARQGNMPEAYRVLNDMRMERGLWEELPVRNEFDAFIEDMVRDAQREWIAEGQLYYLYKRLGVSVIRDANGNASPLRRSEWMLPIPQSENV